MDKDFKNYKDFKIGQVVTCVKNQSIEGYCAFEDDNERLIYLENYTIMDVDFHSPDRICVKLRGPYYFHAEFVPIWYFVDELSEIRDKKLNSILDEPV